MEISLRRKKKEKRKKKNGVNKLELESLGQMYS